MEGWGIDPTLIRYFQSFEKTIYFKKQKLSVAVSLSFAQIVICQFSVNHLYVAMLTIKFHVGLATINFFEIIL